MAIEARQRAVLRSSPQHIANCCHDCPTQVMFRRCYSLPGLPWWCDELGKRPVMSELRSEWLQGQLVSPLLRLFLMQQATRPLLAKFSTSLRRIRWLTHLSDPEEQAWPWALYSSVTFITCSPSPRMNSLPSLMPTDGIPQPLWNLGCGTGKPVKTLLHKAQQSKWSGGHGNLCKSQLQEGHQHTLGLVELRFSCTEQAQDSTYCLLPFPILEA